MTRYFTGKPCKHGHVCGRWVSNKTCSECSVQRVRRSYAANPERHRAYGVNWRKANPEKARAWNRANPEKQRESLAKWRKAHPEKNRANKLAWERANPEKVRAIKRKWEQDNPALRAQTAGRRRARIAGNSIALTPHQRHQVKQIYLLMKKLTLATGTQHHVDHYIPVAKGGPHSPENLWVIPAEQNYRKGSKLPVVAEVDSV